MAAKPMTKGQILDHIAKKTGVTKKLAGQFLEELVALSYKEAKKSFTLPGLGKLVVVNRKKRMGRNPFTGATMVIPAKRLVRFRIFESAQNVIFNAKDDEEKEKKEEDKKKFPTGPRYSNALKQKRKKSSTKSHARKSKKK